ncbi:MAG: hypothetical protein AVDCRST_MAG13-3241, partial [uncultured Solirubrobacteraceae bacterium]
GVSPGGEADPARARGRRRRDPPLRAGRLAGGVLPRGAHRPGAAAAGLPRGGAARARAARRRPVGGGARGHRAPDLPPGRL